MRAPADGFWPAVPLGPGVSLIASDGNGLAALNKPDGVLSHPNAARDERRSLLAASYDLDEEAYSWGAGEKLWLVNRLDSATSGLIVVAARGDLAAEARAQFQKRQVSKAYVALVFGKPRRPSDDWRDVLAVDRRGGRIRAATGHGGLPAECRMTLEESWPAPTISRIRLEPQTGRSHQLRVQCAKRGLPIVGDQTYGDFVANRRFAKVAGTKRMFLHSLSISLSYALAGRTFEFSAMAPLPADFSLGA